MARILNLSGRKMSSPTDEIHTEPDGGLYNIVIAICHLSRRPANEATEAVQELAALLEPMGQLHLLEPSAEFAAREILAGRVGMPVWLHLFGNDEHPLRSAVTLPMLRAYLTDAGLIPARAETRAYVVAAKEDGTEFQADQHVVVGVKPDSGAKRWIE